ncbi:BlaI/MecI/CopY family transcriptional regulator [Saccharopolyspora shandongensis]|uniref:Predicted transcriptional regulator n=1 Tax=Saccharopolyspora shandongensis TaxID=418495 RepID=A0A1H3E2I5_9PSEU|nr:BlaI/MecI/CopY family transcriptional regulator [Saccharopolyspora shandongensis]SDX72847.1 Predicted transcriptional regulator [Saccharopolyspora shandongensis]
MQGLGELEGAVMDVLWQSTEPMTVREVLAELNNTRDLAYTTVMTVLDNLHKKGWVERELHNRAYLYVPAEAREAAAARAMRELLESSGDPEAVLLHFAQSASEDETAVLRRGLRRRSRR